jgi:hypothetical protein
MAFDGSGLIRGMVFDGSSLIREGWPLVGVVYKRDGLWWEWFIRGLAFGGSGLIRGLAFGGSGL